MKNIFKKKLYINQKNIPYSVEGNGPINCFVVGAAGLFRNGVLSKGDLDKIFTFHFIDFWEEGINKLQSDNKKSEELNWDIITHEIEEARIKLNLDEIAILGQSAGGAIAIEYAMNYSKNCFLAIPIAFSPNWLTHSTTKNLKECECAECDSKSFVHANASSDRLEKINVFNSGYEEKQYPSLEKRFIGRFFANQPVYWKNYNDKKTKNEISNMWKDYHPKVGRVLNYATKILPGYNFFKKHISVPKDLHIFWMNGIYDYSAPLYQLTDPISKDSKTEKNYNQVDYYLTNTGHYPMFENYSEFNDALKNYMMETFPDKLKSSDLTDDTQPQTQPIL